MALSARAAEVAVPEVVVGPAAVVEWVAEQAVEVAPEEAAGPVEVVEQAEEAVVERAVEVEERAAEAEAERDQLLSPALSRITRGSTSISKVLLVGWDAADWKVIRPLIVAGAMPNVQRLIEQGASGQMATLHPALSPMLWTSIATGKRPFKHGIHGFSEPAPNGRGVRPITNLSRKSKALWNILNQNGLKSVVIGWWPSHPAEPIDGVMISDHYHRARGPLEQGWPLPPAAVHPPSLADTLAGLRIHPDSINGSLVERFVPRAREIDQDADKRLGGLMRTLAECMSIESAASWLLENQPWDFFAVYFDSIDHFSHGFMRYHPPRQSWIGERDFDLYSNVVSMAYRFHDEMLGRLLSKAGEEATVVLISDHGFHPDHLRPASIPDVPAGPAVEHRDLGIVVMSGPGTSKTETLDGASVLDIAPTILAMYGVPTGDDMDSKVLSQALAEAPGLASIPSWENVRGPDGRHARHTHFDAVAAHEALEQMIALGYVERLDENVEVTIQKTIRELRYNLAVSFQDGGRHREAERIFSDLYAAAPEELRFAVGLFASSQALGLIGEMRRIVSDLGNQGAADPVAVEYLKALVLMADKRYSEALGMLERVAQARPEGRALLVRADLHLRLRQWDSAREIYRQTLALDPDDAQAHLGLCRIALWRREFGVAANAALDALHRTYQNPLAHYLLGRALSGMKEYERAADAYRAAIGLNPNFPEAHLRLAALLENHFGDADSGREHRRLAASMRRGGKVDGLQPADSEQAALPSQAYSSLVQPMPPIAKSLVVVTGLPRSGTSMLMQMLAAGGMRIVADAMREADEDNPRGYFEFTPVKNLFANATWLSERRGAAIKIVAPLLAALPAGLPCRVILCERDLDEVLDSQDRMLERRGQTIAKSPERRARLKQEFLRTIERITATMLERPSTRLIRVRYADAVSDPARFARMVNTFLDGGLDIGKMAAAVAPALYRNRAARLF